MWKNKIQEIQSIVWKRHANPWSVWTRFLAIPLFILAVWSREWIGLGCLIPITLVILWLIFNPFVFKAVENPQKWVSKGIYGEQYWVQKLIAIPATQKIINRYLIFLGVIGMLLCAYGLYKLQVWPTIFGATVIIIAQLWRIDRFSILYDNYIKSKKLH
jgi:hypothetical protein